MTADGNLELCKEISCTGRGKNRGTNKRHFFTFKDVTTKIITTSYKAYNINRSKVNDNTAQRMAKSKWSMYGKVLIV